MHQADSKMHLKRCYELIMLLACMFVSAGCKQIQGLPDRHAKREITQSELVGNWVTTQNSLNSLIQEGYSRYTKKQDHYLALFDDGTCKFCTYSSIPPSPTIQEEEKYYISLTDATWKITETSTIVGHSSEMVPAVEIEKVERKQSPEGLNINKITVRFFIAEENRRIVLWNYIGDPDYTQYMDFVKELNE